MSVRSCAGIQLWVVRLLALDFASLLWTLHFSAPIKQTAGIKMKGLSTRLTSAPKCVGGQYLSKQDFLLRHARVERSDLYHLCCFHFRQESAVIRLETSISIQRQSKPGLPKLLDSRRLQTMVSFSQRKKKL